MLGFGWCHLQTSRDVYNTTSIEDVEQVDALVDKADSEMFEAFRMWMEQQHDPWFIWNLNDHLNNHHGLLTFCLSRNHRSSIVWEVLDWISKNAVGSYGLFYCHDDEDYMGRVRGERVTEGDFQNVYRVHKILNGEVTEHSDRYFGDPDSKS